jgi:hypothetical protein
LLGVDVDAHEEELVIEVSGDESALLLPMY